MKPKTGSFVCLVGIDGSGKTTHAKSLVRFLSTEGCSAAYVRAASRPVISLAFFGAMKALGYWKTTKKGMYTDPLEFAPAKIRSKLGVIWRLLLFVDFQIKTLITVRFQLVRGVLLVADRYVYDVIMELEVSSLSTPLFESLLLRTVPKPSVTFLLDVPEKIARSRRNIPIQQLLRRKIVLLKMARTYNFVVVDASRDLAANRARIQADAVRLLQVNCSNETL